MTFIIAMIVIMLTQGQPNYWYTIDEVTTYPSLVTCEAQIAKEEYQQQVLEGFNTIFGNKVAMIRLACLTGSENVADYRQFMKERNFIVFHHTQITRRNFSPIGVKYFERLKK